MKSRTIKFRTYNKTTGSMYYKLYGCFLSSDLSILPSTEHVVMQFTGKHDSGGVAIYEGDIVRCIKYGIDENFNDTNHIWDDTTGPIEWDEQTACFVQRAEAVFSGMVNLCFPDVIRVLGNIYEHPELLKSTNNATT
jgi:uncharacterized phage protein (TIGR01671 family)